MPLPCTSFPVSSGESGKMTINETITETFVADTVSISKIDVVAIPYVALIGCIDAAQKAGLTGVEYTIAVERNRVLKQCKFFDGNKPVAVSSQQLGAFPLPVFKKMRKAMFKSDEKPGKVVRAGDGVVTSIIYALGTPIKTSTGAEIKELEFMAQTVDDIETVMYQAETSQSLLALLRTVARPIGDFDETEAADVLPEWAVEKITIVDAVAIQTHVMPSFLD